MGIKIDFVKETDKEYEEIKKLIPAASKYALMKVDHLIVVPLFQVMDIINKYEGQEPTTKNNLGVLALLEKTYADFCSCEGGEGWLKIDGKEYSTDAGYALEGMSIFMEVFRQRLVKSEETETWNGIHAQITAPKGTFDKIFNDANDDNNI